MIIFPAIDIRGGRCVRLTKGDFNQETVFADCPADMAAKWSELGAEYLHVVDLDGALAGKKQNEVAIRDIIGRVKLPIQLGGGIRTMQDIEYALDMSITRVIIGSAAVRNPDLVKEACREFGSDVIVAGIDAKAGIVAVDGWGVSGDVTAVELAKRMADAGVRHIVYTDISRDGTLSGVNVAATAELAAACGIGVIASGGVSSIEDIRAVKQAEADGIEGVIVGKAIYTGSLDLKAALDLSKEA